MPEVFKQRLIKLLRHRDYRPVKLSQLAKALGVNTEDYQQFKEAFDRLRLAGHLVIGAGNLVSLPSMSGRIIGTFRANPKGFGFVTALEPKSHSDLFVPANATAGAMTGDIVEARVVKKGRRAGQMRYSGKVTQILERGQNRFVGTLMRQHDVWVVQPDGTAFTEPICVDDVTAKGAGAKDKVVVEILSYPSTEYLARGVIIEVLGRAGRYESEITSIIRQYHLPDVFADDRIEQARTAGAEFEPDRLDGRDDITEKVIVTIDPPDAKDFDDAISLEKNREGNWVLGVHIADVSNFVPADSPLDDEAKIRGNSIYLPGKTIPMLPETLSNGICSLQPGQKRLCKSVYLTYDHQGNLLHTSFGNSVMSSTQRLSYKEADRILKGHTKKAKAQVTHLLKNMEVLSRAIEKRREKNGMLHLDLPERELIMDKSGRLSDVRPADDSYPHTIIEMFMVEANEAVAALLDRLNVPFMRRIHPEPDILSMKNLSKFVRTIGISMPRTPKRADIQELLTAVRDTDLSLAVNLTVLRSLEKAQYSPLHIGHFALASSCYCHFTSPIRRYADLLVHRVLESYLRKRPSSMQQEQDLGEIGRHISFTEQRSEDAENELTTVLILQMLMNHIGDELDGVVTGLAGFGVFVQSRRFGVEGLIKMADLGADQWKYDMKTQSILGQRCGVSIHLGQAIRVRIVSVNVPARQLNVSPVESPAKANAKKTTPKKRKARHRPKATNTRRRTKN